MHPCAQVPRRGSQIAQIGVVSEPYLLKGSLKLFQFCQTLEQLFVVLRQHHDLHVVLHVDKNHKAARVLLEDTSTMWVVIVHARGRMNWVLIETDTLGCEPFFVRLTNRVNREVLAVELSDNINDFLFDLKFVFFGHERSERHPSEVSAQVQ